MQDICKDDGKFIDKLHNKEFLIDKFYKPKKRIEKVKKTKKILTSKFKKEKKVFNISNQNLKYEHALGMNKLWNEYIAELLAGEYLNIECKIK